ncbi:MAG: putative sulfate exporter family transporter [Pseudomonadota bacterium]
MSNLLPGLSIAAVLAICAYGLEATLSIPLMVSALVLGLGVHHMRLSKAFDAGIEFAARSVLRFGVALLGAGITIQQIAALGLTASALAVSGVGLTLACGVFVAKLLKADRDAGFIYGGAVAICGASAAMAISSALPDTERNRATTALAVVGVTVLSTIAMLLYPMVSHALGMDEQSAGVFFGAAIHDVAQVVGAGYMVSDTAGETATIVKLIRVACLVPVVACVGWIALRQNDGASEAFGNDQKRPAILPWFLVGFLALSVIASADLLSQNALQGMSAAAKALLVAAIAALGCKTSIASLVRIGAKPVLMLSVPTLCLAVFVVGALLVAPSQF